MTLSGYCDDSDKPLRDPYHQGGAQLMVNRTALAVTRSVGGEAIATEAARDVSCYKRRQTTNRIFIKG